MTVLQLQSQDLAQLRRRLKASLDAHRRRARADRQVLDYALADLEALALGADACTYCGCRLTAATLAFDHKTPTCRTADYRLANIVVCCVGCNLAKGQLTAVEFAALLQMVEDWHPRARQDLLARLRSGGRRYARR